VSILKIGNVSVTDLVQQYQTPLYVYDQEKMEQIIDLFLESFQSSQFETKILYASKAFQAIEMINLIASKGLGLDIVSGGELYAALQSNIDVSELYFHGNNKDYHELELAFQSGVKHIVCDNFMELEVISALATQYEREMNISLRLNVGVEAHTHEYIVTSHIDSKFGFSYESEECRNCLNLIEKNNFLILEGFHSHIGSQIFDLDAWYVSIDKLLSYLKDFPQPLVLNIGGGFGIPYTDQDHPLPIETVLKSLIHYVEQALTNQQVTLTKLIIEPGRSIVGEAGYTLYTLGYQKTTPGRTYYFVDGGMSDNLRPSLYQAEYKCDIANRLDEAKTEKVTIAGKCCESGDILIKEALLPPAKLGDLLVVYTTGAYGYSMSNQYNRNVIPGVVFVKEGQVQEVVRRQTYADLIQHEMIQGQTFADLICQKVSQAQTFSNSIRQKTSQSPSFISRVPQEVNSNES